MISIKENLNIYTPEGFTPVAMAVEAQVSKEGVTLIVEDGPMLELDWEEMVDPQSFVMKFGDWEVRHFVPTLDFLAKIYRSKDAYIEMC